MATRRKSVHDTGGTGSKPGKADIGTTATGTASNHGAGNFARGYAATPSAGVGRSRATIGPGTQEKGPQAQIPVPPQEPVRERRKRGRKQSNPAESQAAAALVVGAIEALGVAALGEEARINEIERGLVEDPLKRLIEKYGHSVEQYSALLDPLMLIVGFGIYAIRLSNVAEARVEKAKANVKTGNVSRKEAEPERQPITPVFDEMPWNPPEENGNGFKNPLVYGHPPEQTVGRISPDALPGELDGGAINPNDYMRPPEI